MNLNGLEYFLQLKFQRLNFRFNYYYLIFMSRHRGLKYEVEDADQEMQDENYDDDYDEGL